MTVEALRELARKVLGEGESRLRTKKDLVAALRAAGKKVEEALGRGAERARKPAGAAAGKAGGKKGAARARPPEPKAPARKPEPAREEAAGVDPEGFFVARMRGEEGLRQAPHPMTEAAAERQGPGPRGFEPPAAPWEEWLGELPWSYGDDAFFALPRDPRTLYLYWDHSRETVGAALAGLEDARAQLWIFARQESGPFERVRVLDFALESRSYYVHDLEPGRIYRAEIHVVGRGGARLLGRPSNEARLPAAGPSAAVDDRFARIPWDVHLMKWLRELHPGGPFSEEARALLARLSDWSRFARAGSEAPGGRPSSPGEAPRSPSSPWGPFGGR